jgi:ABC-type polysaccharide/polyol phosphate export permease
VIHYRHTQVSWPAVVPLATVMLVLGGLFTWVQLVGPLLLVVGVTTVILLLFGTMTVVVDDTSNPWYYGWGIHFIPGGVLYNASGLSAIELQLTNGRVVRIGTDEPEALAANGNLGFEPTTGTSS